MRPYLPLPSNPILLPAHTGSLARRAQEEIEAHRPKAAAATIGRLEVAVLEMFRAGLDAEQFENRAIRLRNSL